eukprot:m.270224 g.270224  ORF g.270224 m.270224 type:complete len:709 (-) comp16074_c1_seq6:3078-5204(-)
MDEGMLDRTQSYRHATGQGGTASAASSRQETSDHPAVVEPPPSYAPTPRDAATPRTITLETDNLNGASSTDPTHTEEPGPNGTSAAWKLPSGHLPAAAGQNAHENGSLHGKLPLDAADLEAAAWSVRGEVANLKRLSPALSAAGKVAYDATVDKISEQAEAVAERMERLAAYTEVMHRTVQAQADALAEKLGVPALPMSAAAVDAIVAEKKAALKADVEAKQKKAGKLACAACTGLACYRACCARDDGSDLITPLDECCDVYCCPKVQIAGPFPRCFRFLYRFTSFLGLLTMLVAGEGIWSTAWDTYTAVDTRLDSDYRMAAAVVCVTSDFLEGAEMEVNANGTYSYVQFDERFYTNESRETRRYVDHCEGSLVPDLINQVEDNGTIKNYRVPYLTRSRVYEMPIRADMDGSSTLQYWDRDHPNTTADNVSWHPRQICHPVGMLRHDDDGNEQYIFNGTKTNDPKHRNYMKTLQYVSNKTGGECILINGDPDNPIVDYRDAPKQLLLPISLQGGLANTRLLLLMGLISPDAFGDDWGSEYSEKDMDFHRIGLQNVVSDVRLTHSVEIDEGAAVFGRHSEKKKTLYSATITSNRILDSSIDQVERGLDNFAMNQPPNRGVAPINIPQNNTANITGWSSTYIIISTKSFYTMYVTTKPRSFGESIALIGGGASAAFFCIAACFMDMPFEPRPTKVFRHFYRYYHIGGRAR